MIVKIESKVWRVAVAFVAAVLLSIPLLGILYASAAAIMGAALIGSLILVQWPVFILLRACLPKRIDS